MPKESKGDFDARTVEDLRGMIKKWVSIPFGILVVLVAGGCVNLVPYFLELKDQMGFEPIHQEFIKWGVLFGYYGGIIAGPMVDLIGTTICFIIAAIFAGAGFIALAFFTTAGNVGTAGVVGIIFLLIFVSLSCAIATISAIATVIKNFSRNVGSMVTAVMITYYILAPWFDLTVRHGYFEGIDLQTNLIAMGIIHFVVYILAAFIVDENEQSDRLKKASSITDRFGVLIYAAIAAGFIAVIYFTCVIAEEYRVGVFMMGLFILINFIALAFTISALLGQINKQDTSNVAVDEVPPKKNFGEMCTDIRYWCLLFGTFCVVGSCGTYYIEAQSIANAIGNPDVGKNINKAFYLSEMTAILGGGLLAAIFVRLINGWLVAAIAAFSAMLGFTLVFAAESSEFWFFLSAFFVGAGIGGWWVIVPQIITDDAGPRSFESLWGLAIQVNVFGLFCFERLFAFISDKAEPATPADCKGTSCFMVPVLCMAGFCMIAGILAIVGFNNDEGTGGAGGEKKPLRKNDANKSTDRKSKGDKRDKSSKRSASKTKEGDASGKRSGSRSKSKSGRSKSKDRK